MEGTDVPRRDDWRRIGKPRVSSLGKECTYVQVYLGLRVAVFFDGELSVLRCLYSVFHTFPGYLSLSQLRPKNGQVVYTMNNLSLIHISEPTRPY